MPAGLISGQPLGGGLTAESERTRGMPPSVTRKSGGVCRRADDGLSAETARSRDERRRAGETRPARPRTAATARAGEMARRGWRSCSASPSELMLRAVR